jgi:hypothetical protein
MTTIDFVSILSCLVKGGGFGLRVWVNRFILSLRMIQVGTKLIYPVQESY